MTEQSVLSSSAGATSPPTRLMLISGNWVEAPAREAFAARRDQHSKERRRVLLRIADAVEGRAEELARRPGRPLPVLLSRHPIRRTRR